MFADPPNIKGRLEVSLFRGATKLEMCGEIEGQLVHSKEEGRGMPLENEGNFL